MKTEQTIRTALAKYEVELQALRNEIHDVEAWKTASIRLENAELLVAQRKELEEMRAKEKEADFKIRFVKWLLDK